MDRMDPRPFFLIAMLPSLALAAVEVKALTPFAPEALAGARRENLFVEPTVGMIDARYRAGKIEIHLNLNPVSDAARTNGFYRQYPTKTASRHMRVHQRHYTTDDGRSSSEACSVIRDAVNVCVSVTPSVHEADALKYLNAVDLPGLLALAVASGAPKPFPGDLTFKADAKGWQAMEAGMNKKIGPQVRACAATPNTAECLQLAAANKDCRPGRFDAGLLEGDIELLPVERENFHKLWRINCKLYGAPVAE
jgi:hypothetical protein